MLLHFPLGILHSKESSENVNIHQIFGTCFIHLVTLTWPTTAIFFQFTVRHVNGIVSLHVGGEKYLL